MREVWLPLLLFAALGATWYHVMRLRERAIAHARRICARHGLQFLDDSVGLHRLHMRWHRGALHVLREYRFDTSLGGHDRQVASMTLLRDRVVRMSLPVARGTGVNLSVPAARYAPSLPDPAPQPERGDNVVPIEPARRTLH